MASITLNVAEVDPGAKPIDRVDVPASVQGMLQRRVEAYALSDERLVCCRDLHAFAQAAHDAFYDHYPLHISPDDVWFCLAQGFAHHVNLNVKKLRRRFVSHQGKEKLLVSRADFELGKPNPWPEVFTDFAQQIAGHVGQELHDTIVADFSTTTPIHRTASEILLMDTFQGYFEYEFRAGCGIPQIVLSGAPDDWRNIRRRAEAFASYGMEEWIRALLPVLDQIEATSRGHGDRDFWKSFFRYRSGSGPAELTGWIHVLFPYLKNPDDPAGPLVSNRYLKEWKVGWNESVKNERSWTHEPSGPGIFAIPSGMASAPVHFIDLNNNREHDMRFVAGMFGVAQDEASKCLSTAFGWAIVYEKEKTPIPKRASRFKRWRGG